MKRLLAATAFAVAAVSLAPSAQAAGLPAPGGTCEGPVDFMCRRPCTDELDCGLIPPCVVWVANGCLVG